MKHTADFLMLVDLVTRMRASDLPADMVEAVIRAAFAEYRIRAQDVAMMAAAERLALFPPKKVPVDAGKASGTTKVSPKALPVRR